MSSAPPDTGGEPVIVAEHLARSFGRHGALRDVTLNVNPGEIFGLLGPDGAGKTTLMQLFAAILNPTSGRCRVLGFDTTTEDKAVNAQVGYMSQGFTLYERLTVFENLAFSARIRDVSQADFQQWVKGLLDMAGLAEYTERRAENLSGGMRKKLSLCTTLIHRPPLLILDEMSLGVDPLSRSELWDMLRRFRDEGITVVLTTPYMDEAEYCDRLGFLNEGRILAVDAPASLHARAEEAVFEMQTSNSEPIESLLTDSSDVVGIQVFPGSVRFQLRQGVPLQPGLRARLEPHGRLESVSPTLEDAFIVLSYSEMGGEPEAAPVERDRGNTNIGKLTGETAVRLDDVTCTFGDFVAVDSVSLSVEAGQIYGFFGPNGAGKTTLIRAMCGMLRPASGEAHVAGIDVLRDPRRLTEHVGYMSQRFSLYPDLTWSENMNFFAGIYGLRRGAKRDTVRWAADLVGLTGVPDRKVRELSGAVRQRLALACSIVHRPPVLFLDEPTSGVDPTSRHRFWRLIQRLASTGVTVFVTTHYLEEARYCMRIGLMARGRLLADGTIEELREGLGANADISMEEIFMRYIKREHMATV